MTYVSIHPKLCVQHKTYLSINPKLCVSGCKMNFKLIIYLLTSTHYPKGVLCKSPGGNPSDVIEWRGTGFEEWQVPLWSLHCYLQLKTERQ